MTKKSWKKSEKNLERKGDTLTAEKKKNAIRDGIIEDIVTMIENRYDSEPITFASRCNEWDISRETAHRMVRSAIITYCERHNINWMDTRNAWPVERNAFRVRSKKTEAGTVWVISCDPHRLDFELGL